MIKTVQAVDYHVFQTRVEEVMGIEERHFRNYHEIVGGPSYKDLWHVWLWYVDRRVGNDTLQQHYVEPDEWEYEYFLKRLREEFKDTNYDGMGWIHWAAPFLKAVQQVEKELYEESGSSLIWIHYSW